MANDLGSSATSRLFARATVALWVYRVSFSLPFPRKFLSIPAEWANRAKTACKQLQTKPATTRHILHKDGHLPADFRVSWVFKVQLTEQSCGRATLCVKHTDSSSCPCRTLSRGVAYQGNRHEPWQDGAQDGLLASATAERTAGSLGGLLDRIESTIANRFVCTYGFAQSALDYASCAGYRADCPDLLGFVPLSASIQPEASRSDVHTRCVAVQRVHNREI